MLDLGRRRRKSRLQRETSRGFFHLAACGLGGTNSYWGNNCRVFRLLQQQEQQAVNSGSDQPEAILKALRALGDLILPWWEVVQS